MTKEDYMRLPKERLAELLVEKETQRFAYMQIHPLCYEPGGTCTNPFHDCINCPKTSHLHGGWTTATNTFGSDYDIDTDKIKQDETSKSKS